MPHFVAARRFERAAKRECEELRGVQQTRVCGQGERIVRALVLMVQRTVEAMVQLRQRTQQRLPLETQLYSAL